MDKISIIIPVLNEQETINQTIEKIYSLNEGVFEVIVVDSDSEGSTINFIKSSEVIKIISAKGRSKQMNAGAEKATGKVLLFLHADTELPENSLKNISDLMKRNYFKAGAFNLGIKASGISYRIIEKAASLRSRLTRIPYGDQVIFIEKGYFEKIGCFSEIPLMEDVELMRRIKKLKGKIYIIKEKVFTSARRWEKEGILYCTLRNWLFITLYYFGLPPGKLIKYYK